MTREEYYEWVETFYYPQKKLFTDNSDRTSLHRLWEEKNEKQKSVPKCVEAITVTGAVFNKETGRYESYSYEVEWDGSGNVPGFYEGCKRIDNEIVVGEKVVING